jgi:predicted GNAT family N-acyltransferase
MEPFEPVHPEDIRKYYALRYDVLRKPWGQPFSSTRDRQEAGSVHVLLLDDAGTALATGRLQLNSAEVGQIRSMAVREDGRGQGHGSAILQYLEARARRLQLRSLVLDAREPAVGFYEKHGFRTEGKSYVLFGTIQHYRMSKQLS